MSNDTIISCSDPTFHDELTALVRGGARRMLCEALIADVETFCAQYAGETDDQGRRAVVRNGYLPEREILTGIGPVAVRVPQTRDRAGEGRCLRSELFATGFEEDPAAGSGDPLAVSERRCHQ